MLERLKSLALVLLLLLAMGLFYASLTLGLGADEAGLSKLFSPESSAGTGTEDVFSAQNAALPDSLCLLRAGGAYSAEEDLEAVWEQVTPLYEEAMGSGGTPESLPESSFAAMLKAPAIIISYHSPQRFSLLRVWSDAPAEDSKLAVATAVLCPDSSGVALLFRDGGGICWKMSTAASIQELLELCSDEDGANAVQAGSDPTYHALLPEEAVPGGYLSLPVYKAERVDAAVSGELPRAVLTAFELNPYLTRIYQDSAGGMVYVEERSTLVVTSEGDLVYTAAGGGVSYDQPLGENEAMRAARACEAAWRLLTGVWNQLNAGGTLSLDSLVYDESSGKYTLCFELETNGIFIDRGDKYWAQVSVGKGYITDATFCPRSLVAGEVSATIPMRQAAAALDPAFQWRLRIRYMAGRDGLFRPTACGVR